MSDENNTTTTEDMFEKRVEAAIAVIRPYIRSHGGDIELVGVTEDTVSNRYRRALPKLRAMLPETIFKHLFDA